MAILDKSAYQSLVNSRFPDNTSNLITPQNVRDMFTDTKDSLAFLFDSGTIGAQWTFGVSPFVPEPTIGSHAATKAYVDQNVQGVSQWVQSVIDFFDPTGGLPGSPNIGDRYIASATSNGWVVNNIYEYNGSTWDETVATEGLATWNETTDVFLTYNGASWVQFGAVVSHNVLAGLQGGTAGEYYHLTLAQFNGYIDKNANETISGSFTFSSPVTGATPTLDGHYATKAYVDANPASVLAGSGLTKNGSTISLNGEITDTTDNFFTSLEYKLRGVTNGLSVVVDDVNNRLFIGEGASTNLPDDYNSYIGLLAGSPKIKGDVTVDGGAMFTSTDPTKSFNLLFDDTLTQKNQLDIDLDGFNYLLDKTGVTAMLEAKEDGFEIGHEFSTYANFMRGTATYAEILHENAGSLSIQLRLTETSGAVLTDQISTLGFAYGDNYDATGLLNEDWLPPLRAVKGLINPPTAAVDNSGRTLDNSDNNTVVRGDGTFSYTLDNTGLSNGWTTQVVNEGTGTISFSSAQTINSEVGTTPSIENQWTGVTIYYDGTAFTVIGAIS